MAYSAEISRTNPSCFLFVIDQSGSMSDTLYGLNKPKSQGVSDAINRLLQNLVIKCAKSEGIRDYYHVGVIGYGKTIGSALSGNLQNRDLVPVSDIANHPARVEERVKKVDDGAGGLIEQKIKFPVWFDPTANGGTPMCQAFEQANQIIKLWLQQHPDSFPPAVIHITDGESTDGDPTEKMRELVSQKSNDGNVLLFNLHLSSKNVTPISFPDNNEVLPDQYAQMLFQTASQLTPFMCSVAQSEFGMNLSENSKGFVLNADIALIITALEIGTRPSNLR